MAPVAQCAVQQLLASAAATIMVRHDSHYPTIISN